MTLHSIEPRPRNYAKWYGFFSFARNLSNKYWKQLLDVVTKIRLDDLKAASKKVIHKAVEAIGKFRGKKIVDKIVKPEAKKQSQKILKK